MKREVMLLSGLFLGVSLPAASGQITRALLSVDDLSLPAEHHIAAFNIDTWGVSLLSVCHIPRSWKLSQEKYENSAGMLNGRADVHGESLKVLRDLFLVDVYGYQRFAKGDPKGDYHPASFSGWIEIVEEGSVAPGKRRTLRASNFHLKPAARCPVSPPAQP